MTVIFNHYHICLQIKWKEKQKIPLSEFLYPIETNVETEVTSISLIPFHDRPLSWIGMGI